MDVRSGERAEIVLVGDSENSQWQSVDIWSTSSVGTSSDDLDTVGGASEEDRQDPTQRIANSVEPIAAAENGTNKAPKKMLPEQPRQPFAQKVEKKRSFQAPWFDRFKWAL